MILPSRRTLLRSRSVTVSFGLSKAPLTRHLLRAWRPLPQRGEVMQRALKSPLPFVGELPEGRVRGLSEQA